MRGIVLLFNAGSYGLPPVAEEVGMGVTALLAGRQSFPIRLDFVQWIMRLLPPIPLFQVAGVSASQRSLSRWRRDPAPRPGGGRIWMRHVLLPPIPNPPLVAFLGHLRSGGLPGFMHLC